MLKNIKTLSDYSKVIKKLNNNGVRPTKQRMVLAKLLFEKGKRHVSAEDLYLEVRKEDRRISLATVYNTLKQFTKLGILKEVVVDQNKSLYCNEDKSHYHLYIEDEGKVVDIPTENINLDFSSFPACLNLHNVDVIVRVRTLKDIIKN